MSQIMKKLPSEEERIAAFEALGRHEYALILAYLTNSRDHYLALAGRSIRLAQVEIPHRADPRRQLEASVLRFVEQQQWLHRRLAAEFSNALGCIALFLEDQSAAREHFQRACELDPDNETYRRHLAGTTSEK